MNGVGENAGMNVGMADDLQHTTKVKTKLYRWPKKKKEYHYHTQKRKISYFHYISQLHDGYEADS